MVAPSVGRNARWIAVSQAGKITVQLTSLVVLARLLQPADYGQIAMLVVITNFVGFLRDLGTASAIIRSPTLPDGLTQTVYWFNLMLAAGMALLLLGLSWPLAQLFRDPALVPMIAWLAPGVILSSLGAVPKALIERASRFAEAAVIEVSVAAAGLACCATMAWHGYGAFSWVGGTLFSATLSSVLLIVRARWRLPRWTWNRAQLRDVMRYSGNLSAFNIINYFARNADAMIIGRYLGAVELGFYSTAYRVMLFPVHNMAWVSNRALFPVMAHHQADVGKLGELYLRSIAFIIFFSAPLMVGVFVLREPLVNVVLGAQWARVADILAWLAPVGLLQSVLSTMGTVFMVSGRTDLLFRMGLLGTALQVTAFLVGVQHGVLAVAACYLVANAVYFVPGMLVTLRQVNLGLPALFVELRSPLVAALLMGVGLGAALAGARRLALPEVAEIAGGGLLGAGLYLASMWVIDRPRLVATWGRVRQR
jgi:PST family polysaccharide transporter